MPQNSGSSGLAAEITPREAVTFAAVTFALWLAGLFIYLIVIYLGLLVRYCMNAS